MECPACQAGMIGFSIPTGLEGLDVDAGDSAAICSRCLTLTDTDSGAAQSSFEQIMTGFPEGDTGALMAIALGKIVESVALNRSEILQLFDLIADEGTDPWLVVERLAASGSIQTDVDLDRVRRQLEQLSE